MSLAPPTPPEGTDPLADVCAQSIPSARNVEQSIPASASFGATVTTMTSGFRRGCRATPALTLARGGARSGRYASSVDPATHRAARHHLRRVRVSAEPASANVAWARRHDHSESVGSVLVMRHPRSDGFGAC